MKRYKIAAWIMIIHGGFMEIGGVLCAIPALIFGSDKFDIGQYFSFKLQYFQDNLYMILFMGAIFGVMRIIGSIGLLKNKMWGLALSIINCAVTMILMMFLLPFGIQDGLLACSALVLILTQYFGNRKIIE
jgi:predicted membrane protein (DUF2127)